MEDAPKNLVQERIATLQEKGWTLAALADELDQRVNTLEKWKAGDRQPANAKSVLALLGRIDGMKRIPKKKRYAKGSRRKSVADNQEVF